MKKIAVIGDGGWGTALALTLAGNGHEVTLWGPFPDYVDLMRERRENTEYLPGIELPESLHLTSSRREVSSEPEMAVFAVPSRFFREVASSFSGLFPPSCGLVTVSKGFDPGTRDRLSEVMKQETGLERVAALSGPSHAEEVARKIPTAVVVASRIDDFAIELQAAFATDYFRVYTSNDVPGVELGGALKNAIAVAVGISDGLGFGDNTRAALITRGAAEISRLGSELGACPSTFSGLSGIGDLIVTCTSRHSRNRAVGERLGRGESMEDVLASMKQVAEGVWNCKVAVELATEAGVEMPITSEVRDIVHEGKNPGDAVKSLMNREMKPETD